MRSVGDENIFHHILDTKLSTNPRNMRKYVNFQLEQFCVAQILHISDEMFYSFCFSSLSAERSRIFLEFYYNGMDLKKQHRSTS